MPCGYSLAALTLTDFSSKSTGKLDRKDERKGPSRKLKVKLIGFAASHRWSDVTRFCFKPAVFAIIYLETDLDVEEEEEEDHQHAR